jgi:hypothetical protein
MAKWRKNITGIAPLQEKHRDGDITFEAMRDAVVAILRKQLAAELDIDAPTFEDEAYEAVEYMAQASNGEMYDDAKADLYDWCDSSRVWIDPIR